MNKVNLNRMSAGSLFVLNELLSRKEWASKLGDVRRDIDDECGYPKVITAEDYRHLYDRESIATRVVQALPHECWESQPLVFDDDNPKTNTVFEERWKEVTTGIRGESWFGDDEGNPIWEHLRRADVLSGIGSFGVMLVGIDDGLELSEPVESMDETGTMRGNPQRNLTFLRSFDQSLAQVLAFEQDITNPRFGQPTKYQISFHDPLDANVSAAGAVGTATTIDVHWTRLIHLADNLGSSEVFGVPRMQPVYNRLYDLRKLYGGSAEMYWRGAFPGISFETDPSLGGDVEFTSEETEALKDQMEDYMNGLQRYLSLVGFKANSLAPQVVSPSDHIDDYLTAIAILIGIPKRILMGTERGELASSQDDDKWNDVKAERRMNYITPRVIVPTVDRFIKLGVLPVPANDGFSVAWPELGGLSPTEKAQIAVHRTEAIVKYVQGDGRQLVPPMEFLTKIVGFEEAEAESMLEQVMADMEDMEAEDELAEAEQELEDEQVEEETA